MRLCVKSSVRLAGLSFPAFVLISPAGLPVATYATSARGVFCRAALGMTWAAVADAAAAHGGAGAQPGGGLPVAIARAGFAARALSRVELDAVMASRGTAASSYARDTIYCVQSYLAPLDDRRYITLYLDRGRGASSCDTFVYSFSARYGAPAPSTPGAAHATAAVAASAVAAVETGDVLRLKLRRLTTSIVVKLNRQRDRGVRGLALEYIVGSDGGATLHALLGVHYSDARQPSWAARAAVDPDSALVAQLAELMPPVSMPATDLLPSPR